MPVGIPAVDQVAYLVAQIANITAPAAKMEAFEAVLVAQNSTDDIARQFYAALPADNQNGFKGQMYAENGNSSVRAGRDHGAGFGDYMVHHEIRSDHAKLAAANYRAALLTAPTTTGSTTTTGTTTTGSTSTTGTSTTI